MNVLYKSAAIAAASTLLIAGPANAADPNWNYAQISYTQADSPDSSGSSLDTDAFGLNASLEWGGVWHAGAEWASGELVGTDWDSWGLLVGAHPSISANSDLVLELGYGSLEDDEAGNLFEVDILSLAVGVRTMFTDKVELNAKATWSDLDDDFNNASATNVSGEIGGRYSWNNDLSAGLTYTIDDAVFNDDALTIDLRWNFSSLLNQ